MFSAPVSDALTGTGARNPAHYQLDRASLIGALTVGALTASASGDNTVATVSLPPGSFLIAGQSIRIADGMISAAGATDDRRVPGFDAAVSVPATGIAVEGITAVVGLREITVTFTDPVNDAASGETDFASSAANPANYQIDGAPLAANTMIVLSNVNRTATITLLSTALNPVLPVVAGNTISVVDNQIRALFDARLVAAAERSFPVTIDSDNGLKEITTAVGSTTITITFSEAVNGAAAGRTGTTGFATSAINPANYRIRGPVPADYQLSANGTELTITLDSGLPDGSLIEVLGNTIKGAAASGHSQG